MKRDERREIRWLKTNETTNGNQRTPPTSATPKAGASVPNDCGGVIRRHVGKDFQSHPQPPPQASAGRRRPRARRSGGRLRQDFQTLELSGARFPDVGKRRGQRRRQRCGLRNGRRFAVSKACWSTAFTSSPARTADRSRRMSVAPPALSERAGPGGGPPAVRKQDVKTAKNRAKVESSVRKSGVQCQYRA